EAFPAGESKADARAARPGRCGRSGRPTGCRRRPPDELSASLLLRRSADHERRPVVGDLPAVDQHEHSVDTSAHAHGPAEARAARVAWAKHGASVSHEYAAPVRDAKDADLGAVLGGRRPAAGTAAGAAHV